MAIELRLVAAHEERYAIYQFRYAVYVDEMRRAQRYANPAARTIVEPLDETGHLIGAFENGRVVGTVRANFAWESDLADYAQFYRMGLAGVHHPSATSVTTKLMVAQEHRRSTLGLRLAIAIYKHGLENGVNVDFIDCNAHLLPFFTALGYRQHIPNAVHPEYGNVAPLLLWLRDIDYMEKVSSPFARILRASGLTPVPWDGESLPAPSAGAYG